MGRLPPRERASDFLRHRLFRQPRREHWPSWDGVKVRDRRGKRRLADVAAIEFRSAMITGSTASAARLAVAAFRAVAFSKHRGRRKWAARQAARRQYRREC